MIRKILFTVFAFFLLVGCQDNNNYENMIKKLHTVPYTVLKDLNKESMSEETYIYKSIEVLKTEFKDDFTAEALNQVMNVSTFDHLNDYVLNNNVEVNIKKIEMKETGDKQYSYTVQFEVKENGQLSDDETTGSIRFDDQDKVVSWRPTTYPKFTHIPKS